MSLTKEWFEQRDKFIAEQQELGSYTLAAALEELNTNAAYFFDLGILTQREFSTSTINFTQLTGIGGLFFVERCQAIFIKPEMLGKLKLALEDWDNFSINYPLVLSDFTGTISVRNQSYFEFKVDARLFRHRLTFRIKDSREEFAQFVRGEDSTQLLNVWNDFCECVTLIENEDMTPTNIDIASDSDAIKKLCFPWHPIVQRYFRSRMHQIGFEHNLKTLKCEIEQTYSVPNSEWHSLTQFFDLVRPNRLNNITNAQLSSMDDIEVQLLTYKDVNEFGIAGSDKVEKTTKKNRNLHRYCTVMPRDVLLFKDVYRKKVKVAYFPGEDKKAFLCSDLFTVIRAKAGSQWNGERLFLFLTSLVGQTLLEYTFCDFSVNELQQVRLTPRQLSKLEIPKLDQNRASELDDKYSQLNKLMQQKANIEQQITNLMKIN
ncbi:hypothetical protein [Aeromonas fluvialis]|uniref:hypothetical protein n=1 Tax=Aeromonas fluvialis TaxID=591962 RepID=UPI0005A627FE|nr:hypothetical protein [Aeromonas fluvialis]